MIYGKTWGKCAQAKRWPMGSSDIVWYDASGKAQYRSVYGKSYLEVKEKRNAILSDVLTNKYVHNTCTNKQKMTFQNLSNEWLMTNKASVKESTYIHYKHLLDKHILPSLGHLYISLINAYILDDFLRNKLYTGRLDNTGGLSPKSVADMRSVLLLIIEYANIQNYPCNIKRKLFYPRGHKPATKVIDIRTAAKNTLRMLEQKNKDEGIEGMTCRAGRSGFWLSWTGDMLPCGMFTEPKISLLENSIEECWNYLLNETSKLKGCSDCRKCRLRNICKVCAAGCLTETDSIQKRPEYLCQMAQEYEKILIELADK